ncbi:MAG TPA: YggT family protein [Clostridia bacterium]|nr:YggT family protein [Clostridia bacterium]
MEQVTKNTKTQSTTVVNNTAKNITKVILGIIEVLLAFRLVFKALAANANNMFVRGVYALTKVFVIAFEGIFSRASTTVGDAVATLVAMLVVALIAFVIIKLIKPKTAVSIENAEHTAENSLND